MTICRNAAAKGTSSNFLGHQHRATRVINRPDRYDYRFAGDGVACLGGPLPATPASPVLSTVCDLDVLAILGPAAVRGYFLHPSSVTIGSQLRDSHALPWLDRICPESSPGTRHSTCIRPRWRRPRPRPSIARRIHSEHPGHSPTAEQVQTRSGISHRPPPAPVIAMPAPHTSFSLVAAGV